jgi:hypothetical protein
VALKFIDQLRSRSALSVKIARLRLDCMSWETEHGEQATLEGDSEAGNVLMIPVACRGRRLNGSKSSRQTSHVALFPWRPVCVQLISYHSRSSIKSREQKTKILLSTVHMDTTLAPLGG